MSDHKYEITMSNGDSAECDSIAALLTATGTMHADSEYASLPTIVTMHDLHAPWALTASLEHVAELRPRTLATDLAEDR